MEKKGATKSTRSLVITTPEADGGGAEAKGLLRLRLLWGTPDPALPPQHGNWLSQ